MGIFDGIASFFGSKNKVEDVQYPAWYADPNFTGSQDFLNQYSQDLLNKGPNDYYKPIGEYGTPEFLNAMQAASQATAGATDAALARSGRARGGQGAQIAAQTTGDNNAALMYADYVRAMQGRQNFMNTGLGVQQDVRNAGFANQGARNDFNVGGANFDIGKAIYGNEYNRQARRDAGAALGFISPLGGAMVGASGGAGGPTADPTSWLSILQKSKTADTPSGTAPATPMSGVGSVGAIGNNSGGGFQDILAKLLPYLSMAA